MMTTTRTLCDLQGNTHVLEVGSESLLLDGRPCTFLRITHEHIQIACADTAHPITLATGSFWRELAGTDPSAEDAGELLAYRLASWVSQQARIRTLQSTLAQLQDGSGGPPLLPDYRLDPLIEKLLRKFDGTDNMAHMLAEMFDQSPEVVRHWAAQIRPVRQAEAENDGSATQQESVTEPEEPRTTGPLEALPPTEPVVEATSAPPSAPQRPRKAQQQWFFWTPEREKALEEAVACAGGLEQKFSQAAVKRLATRLDYPWKSVEYKIGRWKRERSKETPTEPAISEEDRPEATARERSLLHAS